MLPLLLALWLGPQEKPPEKPVISGSVLDFVSGEPLAKVEVTLQPLRTQNISAAVTISGDHGRFALVDLGTSIFMTTEEVRQIFRGRTLLPAR